MAVETVDFVQNDGLEESLRVHAESPLEWQQPEKFDLSELADRREVSRRLGSGVITGVVDKATVIAEELFEIRNPAEKDNNDLKNDYVQDVLAQGAAFGKWFQMSDGRLVRYADQQDHLDLRTSRFRNLNTDPEQATLYDTTVATFGLSVGSSVVKACVRAGIGNKYIIGDPDRLALTNLGRKEAPYRRIGDRKLDIDGEWISDLDPYIEQIHYPDGITALALGTLATDRPRVIADAVDHLGMKAAMRAFAAEQGIALVMASDVGEKSVIDVERHDLEDVAPFVGAVSPEDFAGLLAETHDPATLRNLMVQIVGPENISPRLFASFMEVGKSLAGIPQLGTTAAMGGNLAAVATREIILGNNMPTGRYVFSPRTLLGVGEEAVA